MGTGVDDSFADIDSAVSEDEGEAEQEAAATFGTRNVTGSDLQEHHSSGLPPVQRFASMTEVQKAQLAANALVAKLQKGEDAMDEAKHFVQYGSSIPDGLVVGCFGLRARGIKSQPDVLAFLLAHKGNPHAEDPMTQGPAIHSACWHGSVEVVKVLLEFKADLEAKEPKMETPPLNTAIAAGNAPVCLELLKRNADVQWKHHDGATALHVATAWIASSHNSDLRMPPTGEEPRKVIAMMLHNGVDPTQTEGMSKGTHRSEGMTPLESFRREIARSPWRTHEQIGRKFDETAKSIHLLLEQAEEAVKLKQTGNKALKEKRYDDALKAWRHAREIWKKADVSGHHVAVLWSNEAICCRQMEGVNLAAAIQACEEGLKLYALPQIRQKLQHSLEEAKKGPKEKSPEEEKKREELVQQHKEKRQEQKKEWRSLTEKAVAAEGGIYGEDGSAQKDYVIPGPFICPMKEAQEMGLGPPPEPKPWWEKRDADSDEEPERRGIGYLPAHHPNWLVLANFFPTCFQLATIELVIRCSSFGFNKTVVKQFSKSVTESQLRKDDMEEAEEGAVEADDANQQDDDGTVARQKYFRHVIFWLHMQDNMINIPLIVQDGFIRMMCILLKPHEVEDVLHNRFTAKQRRLRSNAVKPTDTVLLLIRWFTEYFKRFPDLHLFGNRISPVVEAIDERVTYELSPFFVRDHIFLLFTQVLHAYNIQRTWGKDWFSSSVRGGQEDQPPTISEPIFADLVRRHAFELAEKEGDAAGAQAHGDAEGEGDDDRANMTDIIGELFKVLFKQQDWAAEDWGVDQELMHIIRMILSLGLCNASEVEAAKHCLQRLGVGMEQDFQIVEQTRGDPDIGEQHGAGAGLDEESDEEGNPRNRSRVVGLHRGFVGQEDEMYTPAFQTLKPLEDFGGRLPDIKRNPQSDTSIKQQERLQDFLYELVEMPDMALAKSLHVDVNLWRRQLIQHPTFLLRGSDERMWHVGKEIVQRLQGLSFKLTAGENLLQEFSCEVHVLRPGDGNVAGLSLQKDKRKGNDGHQWRGHGTAGEGLVNNQVYFEVEVNGKDVVFLKNMSSNLGRVKVRLQLLGCHTVTLRSRCLFDTAEFQLAVSNPRMVALTSPKAFSPEVILRAAKVGAQRQAEALRPVVAGHEEDAEEEAGQMTEPDATGQVNPLDGLEAGGKKVSMAKRVIHELMPKFTEKVIDLVEDRCFKFEKQSKGLDERLLQATREHEHDFIIAMLKRSVSFVMLDVFLEKLEVENADLLYVQYPAMVEVYESIQEDSVDHDELDDIPRILKRRIDDGGVDEEGVRELIPAEARLLLVQTWIMRLCHAIRTVAFLGIQRMDILSATDGVEDEQDEKEDDLGLDGEGGSAELTMWSSCRAVLNILQELLSRNDEIEELWARFVASSSQCIVNSPNGKMNLTFLTEKATFFCPFSYQQASASAGAGSLGKLKNFFEEAQVPEVDPLMLVSVLLYHPQALMRLDAFKLGCRILRDPNEVLQEAYKSHTSDEMHLQKAVGFQFCVFEDLYKRDTYTENHIDMMAAMLKLIQQLCEGHLQALQEFLGADYTVEELDIFSAKTLPGGEDEEEQKAEGRRHEQELEKKSEQPTNIVQWISRMIHMILESMQEATMNGREKQYVLVQQLFDTAAELIQGPNLENQATLMENGICADINLLWRSLRADEGTFRGLIQDNEELFDAWMDLLRVMRAAEIAALKFAMSLLEEIELSEDDNDFAKQQEQVVQHKTETLARMIQELLVS
eukprot:s1697_g2.t1